MLLYGVLNIRNIDFVNIEDYLIQSNNKSWILTSILYASYNSVLLIPVLISIKDFIKNKSNIKYIALIVTVITSVLLISVFLFLINIDVDIRELEMPAVYAINRICFGMKNLYGVIILISIFTTAISLGISFLKNVSKTKKGYDKIAIVICVSSILFSQIGFSNLVNLLYPILGFLGLLQVIRILMMYK